MARLKNGVLAITGIFIFGFVVYLLRGDANKSPSSHPTWKPVAVEDSRESVLPLEVTATPPRIKQSQITAGMSNEFRLSSAPLSNGQERRMGKCIDPDCIATLEIIGSPQDVKEATLLLAFVKDSPETLQGSRKAG